MNRRRSSVVVVRVPATTANLGPGFDTLGLALQLYNRVRLTPNGTETTRLVSGLDPDGRLGAGLMIAEAAELYFRRSGTHPLGCDVSLEGDVPPARGLGSSVTVRLGVVAGLSALTGGGQDRGWLLDLVAELEGHPDNAAPAVYGGFTVAGRVGDSVRCLAFPIPRRARFVALIPRYEVKTQEARTLMPESLSRTDAVHNLNRAALVTAAFAAGDLTALRDLFDDRLHQPHRRRLIPELDRVIRAGEAAGAIGGWLSGSGSTIMCLTERRAAAVGRGMQGALTDSEIRILTGDNGGVRVRIEKG
jgi:homoserine kinase